MGRKVIKVHKDYDGFQNNVSELSLYGTYSDAMEQYNMRKLKWMEGMVYSWGDDSFVPFKEYKYFDGEPMPTIESFEEHNGYAPSKDSYLPDWEDEERTHFMMFTTTSDSPMSPPCATKEELARWLVDNKASSFGCDTATYEEWLSMIDCSWTPSGVIQDGKFMSGVEMCSAKNS